MYLEAISHALIASLAHALKVKAECLFLFSDYSGVGRESTIFLFLQSVKHGPFACPSFLHRALSKEHLVLCCFLIDVVITGKIRQ